MTSRPDTLFLDANVLYSACCRDLLIEASLAGLCHCRWTTAVLAEVRVALLRARAELKPRQLRRLFDLLGSACPEALTRRRSASAIVFPPLVDPADAHVLRGAFEAQADVILTFNLRHFPSRILGRFGLVAMTPDDWLCSLARTDPVAMVEIIERCRCRLVRPPLSRADHLKALRRSGLPRLTDYLASKVG